MNVLKNVATALHELSACTIITEQGSYGTAKCIIV